MTETTKISASPRRRFALWQGAAALSTLALVPLATGAMASVDASTQAEIARFMDVYLEVKANYVEPVSDDKLIEGAINGMLASLDPHSGYLDARGYSSLRTQTEGEYGGLGLSVTMEDGVVKVIAPMADTPADRAGIKAGDYITHIGGQLIFGMTLDEAVEQMKGRPGTKIDITVVREGRDKPMELSLTREIIDLKPVKWEVKGDVGVLTVASFSADATTDLKAAMLAVEKSLGKKPRGWILDLRSNPGGLLDEAVGISDLFLERGEIVSQRGRKKGDTERYFAEPGDVAQGAPVVVLIDSGSASASEIVAGALQDQHRALVMGERSFGKGSVQTVLPLTDTTALRLTTARYYTPSGRSVQEGGIAPDIRVPQLSDPDYASRPKFRESDLRRHLINEKKVDDGLLEKDEKADPRFTETPEQLKAKGIDDYQLYYALQTIGRINPAPRMAQGTKPPAAKPTQRN
ncbi:carboxyl-terminal processing protease [Sphingopyxis panaciterrae]|uniref:S41 family peptidase n=1 Tax=Sphingopyxis panaciterrae TaxID=363841 RepID=UPI00142307F0|nr:S41 family peptidase [Sphingopyxis panaciterrae]NIJ38107.1 carboxyl-terminal processing protease [Sphingopyxis panaciterrae]